MTDNLVDNPTFQTGVTVAIVIICAAWLVLRVWMKRKRPGCGGGDCGCPSGEFKRGLAGREKTEVREK